MFSVGILLSHSKHRHRNEATCNVSWGTQQETLTAPNSHSNNQMNQTWGETRESHQQVRACGVQP